MTAARKGTKTGLHSGNPNYGHSARTPLYLRRSRL